MSSLKCVRNGCQNREYTEATNNAQACCYHPGNPIFHEGSQGWSCCKPRTCHFDDFIKIKGCTNGPHTTVKETLQTKPETPDKEPQLPIFKEPKVVVDVPTEQKIKELSSERPARDSAMITPSIKCTPSLKKAVDQKLKAIAEQKLEKTDDDKIAEGTECFRSGCKETYPSKSPCFYHPGNSIFHDALKFWSCCERKTTDFQSFLNQEGCTRKTFHKWKGAPAYLNVKNDWHQTGQNVCCNIYRQVGKIRKIFHYGNEESSLKI